jgi:molybdopterin-biosynthesis enzyme MoeA-like protein
VEAVRRMSEKYDMVVTSGGIGPTYDHSQTTQYSADSSCRHDDITYQSIAKAFGLQLKLHDAAFDRMKRLSKPHKSQPGFDWDVPSAALTAKKRMVELPIDDKVPDEDQVIFVNETLWVPVSCVNGNIHILPGVPRLFEAMIDGMKPRILPRLTDPEGKGVLRILISTPLAESAVAGYLTELAAKAEPKGVKVGSYPRWGKDHNTVTLVGRDREFMESLVPEVEKAVDGRRVAVEGEDDADTSDKDS